MTLGRVPGKTIAPDKQLHLVVVEQISKLSHQGEGRYIIIVVVVVVVVAVV